MNEKARVNQHYVWKHYLEAWAVDDKVSCYRQVEKKPFTTNPRNIGSSRYFYRIDEFTDAEMRYLRDMAKNAKTEEGRLLNLDLVEMFMLVTDLRRQLVGMSLDEERAAEIRLKCLQAELDLGEAWHGKHEDAGLQFLTRLRERDVAFWASDEKAVFPFCFFLAAQYTRTKRMREAVCTAILPLGLDLARVWSVESHLWANEIGLAILRHHRRTHAELLVNESDTPFITGDQPVINLRRPDHPMPVFYYPVTPKIALMLKVGDNPQEPSTRSISKLEVENYNHMIFRWSDDQIYGVDEPYLSAMATLPKVPLGDPTG